MKFWNKQHEVRKQFWTKVLGPAPDWPFPRRDNYSMDANTAKHMCQNMRSKGKFYFNNTAWYFENKHDATIFLLKISK